jgi:hypothetical protein
LYGHGKTGIVVERVVEGSVVSFNSSIHEICELK